MWPSWDLNLQPWTCSQTCYQLCYVAYCAFDILWKGVFYLAFYSKWKNWFVNGNILSETISHFCYCALFSNIYNKINLMAKNGSDLCNFYSKLDFFEFFTKKYFLHFFTDFKLFMLNFHNNTVNISEILKWNLLKTYIQTTYSINFCILYSCFYYGKKNENIFFFFNL